MPGRGKKVIMQSGVIPIHDEGVVLITSRKLRRWIIPKGYVEKGFSPAESAAKEALEEAGLVGTLDPSGIGSFTYRKVGRLYSVEMFILQVHSMLDEWEEMHQRRRRVVSPAEAVELLYHDKLKGVVADYFGIMAEEPSGRE